MDGRVAHPEECPVSCEWRWLGKHLRTWDHSFWGPWKKWHCSKVSRLEFHLHDQSEICLWWKNTLFSTSRQRKVKKKGARLPVPERIRSVENTKEEKSKGSQTCTGFRSRPITATQKMQEKIGSLCYLGIPFIPADGKMATRIQDGDGRWTGWWVKMMLPSLVNLASFLQGFQNSNRLEWICFLN